MWNPFSRQRKKLRNTAVQSGSFARTPSALDQARQRWSRGRKVTGRPLRPEGAGTSRSGILPRLTRPTIQWQPIELGDRWLGMVALLLCAAIATYLFAAPNFYVQHIRVRGVQYTALDEIYVSADLHDRHIFWVDLQAVAKRVQQALPSLSAVKATVTWSGEVEFDVQEREPVLLWAQAGEQWWVAADGNIFPKQSELPLPVVTSTATTPLDSRVALPATLVQGALTLSQLRPDFVLQYESQFGLTVVDAGGWQVHLGTDSDMTNRLALYDAIRADLTARGLTPAYVDVSTGSTAVYQLAPTPVALPENSG